MNEFVGDGSVGRAWQPRHPWFESQLFFTHKIECAKNQSIVLSNPGGFLLILRNSLNQSESVIVSQ